MQFAQKQPSQAADYTRSPGADKKRMPSFATESSMSSQHPPGMESKTKRLHARIQADSAIPHCAAWRSTRGGSGPRAMDESGSRVGTHQVSHQTIRDACAHVHPWCYDLYPNHSPPQIDFSRLSMAVRLCA